MGEFSGPPDPNPVEEYNFRFSESKVSEERVNRYSKLNGQIVIENDVAPISKYRVRNPRPGETRDIYVRQEKVVETYPGGEILAIDSQIGFLGGWVERFVASFSGGGSRGGSPSWCEGKDILVRKKELILSTLKH